MVNSGADGKQHVTVNGPSWLIHGLHLPVILIEGDRSRTWLQSAPCLRSNTIPCDLPLIAVQSSSLVVDRHAITALALSFSLCRRRQTLDPLLDILSIQHLERLQLGLLDAIGC